MKRTSVVSSTNVLSRVLKDVEKLSTSIKTASYNRGGGPAGDYDRHYDKSTGRNL